MTLLSALHRGPALRRAMSFLPGTTTVQPLSRSKLQECFVQSRSFCPYPKPGFDSGGTTAKKHHHPQAEFQRLNSTLATVPPPYVPPPGCDFRHWLVVMHGPVGDLTRDEIIDSFIKTLAKVLGRFEFSSFFLSLVYSLSIQSFHHTMSQLMKVVLETTPLHPYFEEKARMSMYSVSTRHYYAFGAKVEESVAIAMKELPGVRWVIPDAYVDVENELYGDEPFINGQAVPYDPKYHKQWTSTNNYEGGESHNLP
ncbi:hypothetical protein RHGRI_021857 [Rhododendron griersonianum]|uniref:MORF/ORRM1/DAG-like MORF domain-containing protein n=1 Tax=Rhododendron griersonianum TaxID=479676 RepID=A0AAV6JPW8_9ERIC|nr:hypothetical protein RHGRI_021857 [Rhododendron griersonianum]